MEDAHTVEVTLQSHPNSGFFGIWDGHAGSLCAEFLAERMHLEIDKLASFDQDALAKVCLQVDQEFLDDARFTDNNDGCAGVFVIAEQTPEGSFNIINANIGDSRIVLAKSKGNNTFEAITCTEDHKPTLETEKNRIEAAGGFVYQSRVDGMLAVSRAFGDRQLKTPSEYPGEKRKVTSYPEFTSHNCGKNDFLFLSCDGIFEGNIFERQDLVDWIGEKLKESEDIAVVCADVLDECLRRGSRDNMSAMIVQFVDGTTYSKEKWEYVPGPFHEGNGTSSFQEAYQKDAEAAGYDLEQAKAMYNAKLLSQVLQVPMVPVVQPETN